MSGITVIACGRRQATCYRCKSKAVKVCDGPPLKDGDKTCGRLLCGEHARGTRCSQHAPETPATARAMPPAPPLRGRR